MSERAFPAPIRNEFNKRFWENIDEGRLTLQECGNCGYKPYPPKPRCPNCFGELAWKQVDGTGEIYSYGVVHRPNRPSVFEGQTPFILAVITLDEGPAMVSNIVDTDPSEVEIGQPVELVFQEAESGITLPKFETK